MGTPNIIKESLTCPRCSHFREMEIESIFGVDDYIFYKVGDIVRWIPRVAVHNGGRPENGNEMAEGYVECPSCQKDFWVIVEIRNDQIRSVMIDEGKPGMIPD